jgi:2-polyprenyl-3-methyl-5-hydroxy-6-metoxy-1,4-benzoquinol methylase
MDIKSVKAMIAVEKEHPWYQARLNFVNALLNHSNPSNTRILDFGCGSGGVLRECITMGFLNVKGMDTSTECIESARARGITCELLTRDLPALENEYDFILCLDVLEHLENDQAYLELFKSGLHENGKILITVPAHSFLWSPHDVFNHHFRRYSRKSLIRLAEGSGLKIDNIRYWNSTLFPIFLVIRPLSRFLKRNGASEFKLPPRFFRPVILSLLNFEAKSITMGNVPGVSLVAILSKA